MTNMLLLLKMMDDDVTEKEILDLNFSFKRNLSKNRIHTIEDDAFESVPQLQIL